MKASLFLGVPHAQVNAYIQKLSLYQIRTKRGNKCTIPDLPDFILTNDERRDSGTEEALPSNFQRNTSVRPNNSRNSNYTISSRNSSYHYSASRTEDRTAEQQQNERKLPAVAEQAASLWALKYASCMLDDIIGPTIKRTWRGDPASAKTYGWRLISAELLLNPHLTAAFVERVQGDTGRGDQRGVQIVYIGISGDDVDYRYNLKQRLHRSEWSANPHEALAYSRWICPMERKEDHDPKNCCCKGNSKKVLVCAALRGEDNVRMGALLPLRIERLVWRPKSVEELRAYAEFARGVAVPAF